MQLLFTYASPFQDLFETKAMPAWIWPWLLLGGLMFFLVVETEKLIIRMTRPRRSPLGDFQRQSQMYGKSLSHSHLTLGAKITMIQRKHDLLPDSED
jgi:hypothetical protein